MSRRHRRSIALYLVVLFVLALVAWVRTGVAHADDTVVAGPLPSLLARDATDHLIGIDSVVAIDSVAIDSVVAGPLPGPTQTPPLELVAVDAQPPGSVAPPTAGRFRREWRAYLAAERALNIARLRAYHQRGVFPLNETQEGYLDIFVDAHGTRCAMANLIALSGHAALVAEVAREDNTRQLIDVTDGPLLEWMLTSGLTQTEAGFVQEPDFMIEQQTSPAEKQRLLRVERERLRAHFRNAERELVRDTATSLEAALDRLGARIDAPPPARTTSIDVARALTTTRVTLAMRSRLAAE